MYTTATTGKGAMPARGGTTASDTDLRAAVDYMAAAAQ
jgi:cytochrome c5